MTYIYFIHFIKSTFPFFPKYSKIKFAVSHSLARHQASLLASYEHPTSVGGMTADPSPGPQLALGLITNRHSLRLGDTASLGLSSSSSLSLLPAPVGPVPPLQVQVIALSATMGNVEELAHWVGGSIFKTNFRPVPLIERIKAGNELLDLQGNIVTMLPTPVVPHTHNRDKNISAATEESVAEADTEHLKLLSEEALRKGQQVLIFCSSKFACVQTCRYLVSAFSGSNHTFPDHLKNNENTVATTHKSFSLSRSGVEKLMEARRALVQQIFSEQSSACYSGKSADEPEICTFILHGIAFHNAGKCCLLYFVIFLVFYYCLKFNSCNMML